MPPASRGAWLRIPIRRPRIQMCFRRHISVQKPRDHRSFPSQARSQFRAEQGNAAELQSESQNEQHLRRGLFQGFRKRFSTPQWLKDRPRLRGAMTGIYAFSIAFPIIGFLMMHTPIEWHRIVGPSMKPTMNPDCDSENDTNYSPTHVLVQKYNPNMGAEKRRNVAREGWLGNYNRGDLVAYRTPHDPDRLALKRVVGVPGDTVVPLQGYEGGQDPVTIQYYHLWLEGDVNDRKKSVDSNYFGPISEALIIGKVMSMWSPWWNIFGARRPDRFTDDWPAKNQGRVAERAVYLAATNPDKLGYLDLFKPERGEAFLRKLRDYPEYMKGLLKEDEYFKRTMHYYREHGIQVAESHENSDMRDRAQKILQEMERVFGTDVLDSPDKKVMGSSPRQSRTMETDPEEAPSFSKTIVHEDEKAVQREARERPAKAALKDMVKQTRAMAEQKQKEIEERQRKEV